MSEPPPSRLSTDRVTAVVLAALGSLVVHSFLFAPWLFGGHSVRKTAIPMTAGAAASAQEPVSSSLTAFFLNDDVSAVNKAAQPDVASTDFLQTFPVSEFLDPVSQPAVSSGGMTAQDDDQPTKTTTDEASGDQSGRALLFGRYLGQISARISRAWRRPRTGIAAGSFACRVRITQDTHGNVGEIELRECTADVPWQLSLVHAIESASPLPAPPDPTVFSSTVTLDFDSPQYSPGANEDLFDPPPRLANVASPP